MADFAHEGKRNTVRAWPPRNLSGTRFLSSQGHQSAGRSNGTGQGESKIVHFRQLFRKGLGTLFPLDTEGESAHGACITGHDPQDGSSHFFLYLCAHTRRTMISESQISSTFVTLTPKTGERSPLRKQSARLEIYGWHKLFDN